MVAHLTLTRGFNPSRVLRALQGDASPDDLSPRLVLGDVNPVSDAAEAITLRKELGENLLAEFIKASQGIATALVNVGPQDWDKRVFRPSRAEPIRSLVDILISELAVHGWDVRSRFDSQAGLSPGSVAVMVERNELRGGHLGPKRVLLHCLFVIGSRLSLPPRTGWT